MTPQPDDQQRARNMLGDLFHYTSDMSPDEFDEMGHWCGKAFGIPEPLTADELASIKQIWNERLGGK